MTTYLVECYWPGVDEQRFTMAVDRLAASSGLAVTWKSSILIPDDEIVLCLASGPSVEAVRESARRAGVAAERVVPCVIPSEDRTYPRINPTPASRDRRPTGRSNPDANP